MYIYIYITTKKCYTITTSVYYTNRCLIRQNELSSLTTKTDVHPSS